jgi:hypothetical protein
MDFISTIPFAKIVYTAVLAGLIVMLSRELYSVWWDHGLYVGQFHISSTEKSMENKLRRSRPTFSGNTNCCDQP